MGKRIMGILGLFAVLFIATTPIHAETECDRILETIDAEHWSTVSKYQNSWYAAGLALGAYYVQNDCNTAEKEVDLIIDLLWENTDKYGQNDDWDKLAAGLRFVSNQF